MFQLTDEIRQSIEKQLPAVVGKNIIDMLNSGNAAQNENAALKERILAYTREIDSLRARITEEDALRLREATVLTKEQSLHQRTVDFELAAGKQIAEVATARADTAMEFMRLFLRNEMVRKTVSGNENLPYTYSEGGSGHMKMPYDETETVEKG